MSGAEVVTKLAQAELQELIRLANTLIKESINQLDPIKTPERTIEIQEIANLYSQHAENLARYMDQIENYKINERNPHLDEELNQARFELEELVNQLNDKLSRLDEVCFWMDNMVYDKPE